MKRNVLLIPALLMLALLSGCIDDESLNPPQPVDDLFMRYVAIGNSITAGYQSGGINATLQRQSYAALLAQAMNTPFELPLLRDPGCPPPYRNILTGERIATIPNDCALREVPPPRFVNNVAVPGARTADVLNNFDPWGNPNALTQLILGGYTQLQLAARAHPTFVTVWIGNNDVLGSALASTDAFITPQSEFEKRYDAMLDSLQAMGVQGGLLIGVAKVTNAPYFSLGGAYAAAEAQGALPPTFDVADNCYPPNAGAGSLIPFPYAGALLAQAMQGTFVTLDCTLDDMVLTAAEAQKLAQAVANYNSYIQQKAQELGWAYLDPNVLLEELKNQGAIPPLPNFTTTDPNLLFGEYVSQDGLHPSSKAHRLVAQAAAEAINQKYGTSLSVE